jgi:hypothetical protein
MLRKPLFFKGVLMKTKGRFIYFYFPKNKTARVIKKLKHQHTILFYFNFKKLP